MSQKPLQKSGTKRPSKGPEPTGDSSDSGRSRSLSTGRSSARRLDTAQRQAAAQSKWKLQNYESTSEDSDKGNFTDSVSKTTKFRRSKRLQATCKETVSSLPDGYKIPKKGTKQFMPKARTSQLTKKLSIKS